MKVDSSYFVHFDQLPKSSFVIATLRIFKDILDTITYRYHGNHKINIVKFLLIV